MNAKPYSLKSLISFGKQQKKDSTNLYNLFSGSTILLISAVLANILSYLFHLGSARLLSVEQFGTFQTIITLINMLTVVTVVARLQLTKVLAALIAKQNEDLAAGLIGQATKVIAPAGISITALVFLLSKTVPISFGLITFDHLIVVSIITTLTLLIVIHRSYLRGSLKFFELAVSTQVQSALRLLLIIPLLYIGYKLPGALFGLLMAYLITYMFIRWQLRVPLKKALFKRSSIKLKLFGKEALYTMVGFVGLTSFISSDLLLVQYFLPEKAGPYAALMLFGKVMLFLTTPISSVLFPLLVSSEKRERSKIYQVALVAVAAISLFVLLSYILVPEFLISTLLSPSYLVIAPLLPWYGLFIVIYVIVYAIVNAKIALEKYIPSFFVAAAAGFQALAIILFHDTLAQIVTVSLIVATFTLICLLIYQKYENILKAR